MVACLTSNIIHQPSNIFNWQHRWDKCSQFDTACQNNRLKNNKKVSCPLEFTRLFRKSQE